MTSLAPEPRTGRARNEPPPEKTDMGWSLAIATERDPDAATWLGKELSNALFEEGGPLQVLMDGDDLEALMGRGHECGEDPESWAPHDPDALGRALERALAGLRRENERLPILHMLWPLEAGGRRLRGSTRASIPEFEPKSPHEPTIKLDGWHQDVLHRHELKRYRVRVDPERLARQEAFFRRKMAEAGVAEGQPFHCLLPFPSTAPDLYPLTIEEPDGWIPATPVVEVMGRRIEVESEDAVARWGPCLAKTLETCRRAKAEGLPLFWLSG